MRTFIFAYVFKGKGQAGVLPLDNAYFPKSALANDSQETKVIEVDCAEMIRSASCCSMIGESSIPRDGRVQNLEVLTQVTEEGGVGKGSLQTHLHQ